MGWQAPTAQMWCDKSESLPPCLAVSSHCLEISLSQSTRFDRHGKLNICTGARDAASDALLSTTSRTPQLGVHSPDVARMKVMCIGHGLLPR